MPYSVVDLYTKVLPRTNCGECGYKTCIAFAGMVVSEKIPLKHCPHIDPELMADVQKEVDAQHTAGKWTRRDMSQDALKWAKERAASMTLEDVHERIGGKWVAADGKGAIELPYFNDTLLIRVKGIQKRSGAELTRWEQVFIYNHMAQGGRKLPTGNWKGLVEFPNTVSKMKSMRSHVETPLIRRFSGRPKELIAAGEAIGGKRLQGETVTADVAMLFSPLPRVPVMMVYWGPAEEEGYEAEIRLLFDETIVEHLDIESMMFLSERIRQLLCGE